MNSEFEALIDQLPSLLEQLTKSPLKPWDNLGTLPQSGVYVFYENEKALYVGRTNRMKSRIREHGRQSSTHNSAPFAFNIAKKIADEKRININKRRNELEKNPDFTNIFCETKKKVSKMSIRVIEINDPIIQTLFEVYASIALKTMEYNDFDTH